MRRALFTFVAGFAVFAFVPATAMARNHHRRHHSHHVRRHGIRRFGHFTALGSTSTTTTTPAGVATVTSFDQTSGKLVITLNDGTTTETGLVTNDTEIECQSSQQMGDDIRADGPGDGGGPSGGDNGDESGGGDNSGDDDQGEDQAGQSCSTASLIQGAVILAAELKIDSSGAVWDRIELAS